MEPGVEIVAGKLRSDWTAAALFLSPFPGPRPDTCVQREADARLSRRGTSPFRLRPGLCFQRIASAAERLLRIALDATLQAPSVSDDHAASPGPAATAVASGRSHSTASARPPSLAGVIASPRTRSPGQRCCGRCLWRQSTRPPARGAARCLHANAEGSRQPGLNQERKPAGRDALAEQRPRRCRPRACIWANPQAQRRTWILTIPVANTIASIHAGGQRGRMITFADLSLDDTRDRQDDELTRAVEIRCS